MMKKLNIVSQVVALSLVTSSASYAAGTESRPSSGHVVIQAAEPFKASVLVSNLDAPWDMLWGPDN
jgi:hypothetical protein